MEMSQSADGWETGGHLKPALTAVLIVLVVTLLSIAVTGLPH